MVLDAQPTGFKNGGFLKTSQLNKCRFAYTWYPLLFIAIFLKWIPPLRMMKQLQQSVEE
jgi:hypothetical protein